MDELGLRAGALLLSVAASLLWLRERRRRRSLEGHDRPCLLIPQPGPERRAAVAVDPRRAPQATTRRPAAAGWPFRRRGAESLRIEAAGGECQVIWRVGDEAVAQLAAADELVARSLYAWLGRRFGTGAARLERDRAVGGAERVVARRSAAAERELALLAREGRGYEVVELVHGALRSTARVLDAAEGQELLDLLADPAKGPPSDDSTDAAGRLPRTAAAALAAVFD